MSFLFEETSFEMFGTDHLMVLFVFGLIACGSIIFANRKLNESQKTKLGLALACIPLISVISRMGMMAYLGKFDIKADLPFFLCRVMSFLAIYVMLSRNRFWLGVLYFWIIVGTVNATITPDLANGFPHYDFILYFSNHAGLVVLAFYIALVYKPDIKVRDMINTFVITNVFLIVVHLINMGLDANYMYTMKKPPTASLMDYLGPWPWYLLSGQVLAVGLMILGYLPFLIHRRLSA